MLMAVWCWSFKASRALLYITFNKHMLPISINMTILWPLCGHILKLDSRPIPIHVYVLPGMRPGRFYTVIYFELNGIFFVFRIWYYICVYIRRVLGSVFYVCFRWCKHAMMVSLCWDYIWGHHVYYRHSTADGCPVGCNSIRSYGTYSNGGPCSQLYYIVCVCVLKGCVGIIVCVTDKLGSRFLPLKWRECL